MRLFVALELPPEVRKNFATLIRELHALLPEVRWTPVKNIHLTLKFLGEVSVDSLATIRGALKKVKRERAISLRAAGLDSFHGRGRGAVVFAKVAESTQLAQLASEIDDQFQSVGIAPETRSFVPHLTLGRSKNGDLPKNIDEILLNFQQREFANFLCSEVCLIESKLKPAGAEYTILQSFSFVTEPQN